MRAVVFLAGLLATLVSASANVTLSVAVKDTQGANVADAVISLHALDAAAAPAAPSGPIEVIQRDQEYAPFVTVVRVGTEVVFPNQDDVQHHIYSLSKAKRFEKPLYDPGAHETVVFDQPGVVTLGCNIHDWMVAYIVVLPTPYFGQTDRNGSAQITAPAGRYRVELWHPRLAKTETQETTLTAGAAPLTYTLKLKPDRRIRRAPESKTSGY